MADIWMDVDTALAEVPVNILPLIDDTDFKTREVAIVYNQAGMDLVWNFVTTAGATTQTAVTPTTGGDYDWAHQGDGMYSIEIPASGGASINNTEEGFGWFTGFATGVLPWRGPIIGFRASGLNDLLIDSAYSATRGLAGTALPAAAADAAGGLPISDGGGLDLDTQIGTDIDAILVDTGTTLDGLITTVDTVVDSILVDTAVIGALGAGLTAIPWNSVWDAEVQSEVADALGVYDPPTKAEMDAAHALLATAAALTTVDTAVDAILVDTGTTLNGLITTVDTVVDGIQADLDNVTDGLGALKIEIDANETKIDAIDTVVDFILVDTAVIGALGAGLTAIPWNAAWDAEAQSECVDALNAYDPSTNAEMLAAFAALNDLNAAQVNAEVLDVLNVDTFAEPGQAAPGATISLAAKINYLYKAFRNKITQTATTLSLFNDVGAVVDQKAAVSDDGATYTRGKLASGP